ncbi:hypothetical protein NHX12_025222, partial [Muraenolepis orangiensis]
KILSHKVSQGSYFFSLPPALPLHDSRGSEGATSLRIDTSVASTSLKCAPITSVTPTLQQKRNVADHLGYKEECPQLWRTTHNGQLVKETPRSHQRAPLHSPPLACPNCE